MLLRARSRTWRGWDAQLCAERLAEVATVTLEQVVAHARPFSFEPGYDLFDLCHGIVIVQGRGQFQGRRVLTSRVNVGRSQWSAVQLMGQGGPRCGALSFTGKDEVPPRRTSCFVLLHSPSSMDSLLRERRWEGQHICSTLNPHKRSTRQVWQRTQAGRHLSKDIALQLHMDSARLATLTGRCRANSLWPCNSRPLCPSRRSQNSTLHLCTETKYQWHAHDGKRLGFRLRTTKNCNGRQRSCTFAACPLSNSMQHALI